MYKVESGYSDESKYVASILSSMGNVSTVTTVSFYFIL